MRFNLDKIKKIGYQVMPNKFLNDNKLSLKAKGLLATFYSLPIGWDYSMEGLAKITNTGITALRSTIKELEFTGYLERVMKKDEKGQFQYFYIVNILPQKKSILNTIEGRKLKAKLNTRL